jgi:hypothetical protein
MIGTEVIVEGGNLLDVYEGVDFSFNYSVSDIRNPDTRQTEFTKTIKVPGTANNNTLFGNLFEADIANLYNPNVDNIGANFNPNKKASVQVLQNTLPQLDGSMQLRNITITKGRIEYEVVFIGRLIDIFGVWGDQQLNGRDDAGNRIIDISDLDHTLTEGDQSATWFAPVGVGYVYPLIDYGRDTTLVDSFGVRRYPVIDLRPALYVQELWNRIFAYADATYEGAFFTDGTFERLCLPWVNGFELSEDDITNRTIYTERSTATSMFAAASNVLNTDIAPVNPFTQYDTTTFTITMLQSGVYVFEGQIGVTVTRTNAGFVGGTFQMPVQVYVNGVFAENAGYADIDLPATSLPIGTQVTTLCVFTSFEMQVNAGDTVQVIYSTYSTAFAVLSSDFSVQMNLGTFMQCRVVSTELQYGNTVYMNFGMPETTIKDFFLSILKMFNLYMTPSKTVDRHYIFQTRNDYYASGVLRDWTYKLARDKQLSVTPMGLLSGREYVYTYSEDGDYYNERFQSNYGKAYGHRSLNIDNDFVPEKKETSVVFSGTPLVNDGISSRIIPKIYDADISEGAKQTDANIRILYYGGMLDSSPSWRHEIVTGTVITYDQYPYAGHWDNPITPTLDINWGLSPEYYYQSNGATGTVQVTNNNLFKKYHEAQFLELASKDSKLITAMFDLTALDIHQLDFRDTILIDQTYYRLNRVMDYNPFKAGLTKVELFKAGDIVLDEKKSAAMGSGKSLGSGKLLEPAPINPSKRLLNGNQFEPFQGKVIGRENVVSPNAIGFFVQGDNNRVGASKNVTLIGSNNVVADGLENVTAIGVNNQNITESNTVINGSGGVQVATLELTSAQILALNTTPVSFGITVPVGYYAQLLSAQMKSTYGGTPYATNLTLEIGFPSVKAIFSENVLGFNANVFFNMDFDSSGQQVSATDVVVSVNAGNPTAGNSTVKLYLTYILVQI